MMVVSIALACASGLLMASIKQNRLAVGKADSQADSRVIIETLTRDLRVAVPNPAGGTTTFTTASATSMTFFTSRGATADLPLMVTYDVNPSNSCLRRSTIAPTMVGSVVTYNASAAKTNCIAFGRISTTSTPIFTYFTIAPKGVVGAASLPADIAKIGSVQIQLRITSPVQPTVTPTVVSDTVTLINQSNAILGATV